MTVGTDSGMLKLEQNGAVVSTGTVLKAFTEKQPEHFILHGGAVRSVPQLQPHNTPEGQRQRAELIASRGLAAFESVVNTPNMRPGVVASREMSKAD